MNVDDILARFHAQQEIPPSARGTRRRQGQRGKLYARVNDAPAVPRYIRRHFHRVAPVDFTVRSALPKRRERKMQARITRAGVKRGLV